MDWRSWGMLLAAALCFCSFLWGLKFHFRMPGKSPRGMQILSIVSFLAFACFLYGVSTNPAGYRVAPFGLCIVSLVLFWWCIVHTRRRRLTLAFSLDTPAFLDTKGPYQMACHPFYLSYLLFWVATALAVPGVSPWAAPAIMTVLYTLAATREEAKFANSALEQDYRSYSAQTGMFCPLLPWQRRIGHEA